MKKGRPPPCTKGIRMACIVSICFVGGCEVSAQPEYAECLEAARIAAAANSDSQPWIERSIVDACMLSRGFRLDRERYLQDMRSGQEQPAHMYWVAADS